MVVSCIYITKKTENGTWHLLILAFLSFFFPQMSQNMGCSLLLNINARLNYMFFPHVTGSYGKRAKTSTA